MYSRLRALKQSWTATLYAHTDREGSCVGTRQRQCVGTLGKFIRAVHFVQHHTLYVIHTFVSLYKTLISYDVHSHFVNIRCK